MALFISLFVLISISVDPAAIQEEVLKKVLAEVEKELIEVARRVTKSVLRERGFTRMSTLNFEEVVKEVRSQCPTVYKILSQMVQPCIDPDKKKAPLALIYGMIMFKRCKELSLVLNTVLLNDGVQVKRCVLYYCVLQIVVYCLHVIIKNNVKSTFVHK